MTAMGLAFVPCRYWNLEIVERRRAEVSDRGVGCQRSVGKQHSRADVHG